jgi:hypothetical protein
VCSNKRRREMCVGANGRLVRAAPLSFSPLQEIKDSFSGCWLHVCGVRNANVWQAAGMPGGVRTSELEVIWYT